MKPTLEEVSVETSRDALILITAVMEGILDPISSRPDRKKEWTINHGDVYVFNQTRTNIKRWTDRLSWGPSRGSGLFFYYKRTEGPSRRKGRSKTDSQESYDDAELTKKTIAAESVETGDIYYCISYYYTNRIDTLKTVDQIKDLQELTHGEFIVQKKKEKLEDTKGKFAENTCTKPKPAENTYHHRLEDSSNDYLNDNGDCDCDCDCDCDAVPESVENEDCQQPCTSHGNLLFANSLASYYTNELTTSLTETLLASSDYFDDVSDLDLKSKFKSKSAIPDDIWLPGMSIKADDWWLVVD